MPQRDSRALRDWLAEKTSSTRRYLWGADAGIRLDDLVVNSCLGGRVDELRDRCVLIATRDQFTTALALIELDGFAHRLVICPAEVTQEQLPAVVADAGVDAIVSDCAREGLGAFGVALKIICGP